MVKKYDKHVTATASELAPVDDQLPLNNKNRRWLSRAITITGLGVLTVGAYVAQQHGLTNELPQPLEAASESLAHIGPGWYSAAFAYWANKRRNPDAGIAPSVAATAVGALAGDLVVEQAQEMKIHYSGGTLHEGSFYTMANARESIKDAIASGLGGVLFWMQEGRQDSAEGNVGGMRDLVRV